VSETLRDSGYTNLKVFENGEETWNWLQQRLSETGDVRQVADLLISDVEMPRIDGLHLTKNIKDHPVLKNICVLLYSSIVTADNRKKGAAVKADGMITKPELYKVVDLADDLIINRQDGRGGFSLPEVATTCETPAAAVVAVTTPEVAAQPQAAAAVSPPDPPPTLSQNTGLWQTYRQELAENIDQLSKLCLLAKDEIPGESLVNDTFRLLHSVKSASMVVPVDEVTQLTHIMEDVMDVLRQGQTSWPQTEFGKYVDWLSDVANPAHSQQALQKVLADSHRLRKEFTANAQG
jgi:CheY-like chemotaxis protein